MNTKELIEKYEYLNHNCFRRVDTSEVLRDLKQLDESQKPVVPHFVENWIEQCKNNFGFNLKSAMNINTILHYSEDHQKLLDWIKVDTNQEIFARAWLDGYEVEKEPKYIVKLKNGQPLVKAPLNEKFYFNQNITAGNCKATRKQLEEANFGWVFDCEGVEVEEV